MAISSHFNPLPSCEGRLYRCRATERKFRFQSTPLMRGETFFAKMGQTPESFQSTPLMRGETAAREVDVIRLDISIHSPHARGDYPTMMSGRTYNISIHSPHARGDAMHRPRIKAIYIISIHSPHTRGDTVCSALTQSKHDFNPLPSYEGRRGSDWRHILGQ